MRNLKLMLGLSGLGVFLGLFAFITFLILGNLSASAWALVSVIFAAGFFHLCWLYKKGNLLQWHNLDSLNGIQDFSFFVAIISAGAMVWFIFKTIYYHEAIYPIADSSQIAAVWAFMSLKWAGSLSWSCKSFKADHGLRT
uniref:Heme transporter hrg1-A n=1 Tax=Cacopsylla melanoneura TaxID=428564 RepID=A0A8D8TEU6_9HEMI